MISNYLSIVRVLRKVIAEALKTEVEEYKESFGA